MSTNIYVLKLVGDKYYIGKAANILNRIQDHIGGTGSAWTKIHKVVDIEKIMRDVSPFDEDKITKEYMSKYGIDNVRGGSYCTIKLTDEQIEAIIVEIKGAKDLCNNCGKTGHFIGDCPLLKSSLPSSKKITKVQKSQVCYRCGRDGHFVSDCYAGRHIDGHYL